MNLTPLCDMEMHYTWIDFVDYGIGGQYVGTLEGTVKGDRLRGSLKSVNVPAKRPDNVNCPAFRGIIVTDDGVRSTSSSTASPCCEQRIGPASLRHRFRSARAMRATRGSMRSSEWSRESSTRRRIRPSFAPSPARTS